VDSLIQSGRLSFVRHPVQSFASLAAHAHLAGEKVGEHDAPVPAALLKWDLVLFQQPVPA
jgi:hypothetical protein